VRRLCVVVDDGSLLSHNHKFLECIYTLFFQALISYVTSEVPLLSACKYPGSPTSVVEYRKEVQDSRTVGRYFPVQETAAEIRIKSE
jgi:hypothetical protein